SLLLGQVPERVRRRHRPPDGAEAQRRLVVGGGDEQPRGRRRRGPPDRRVVEVGHEEGWPIGSGGERVDQRGGERPLAHQPRRLRPERRRKPKDRPAHLVEEAGPPPSHHLETPNPHRAVQVVPGGKRRRPGRLVARRGRPDLDVPPPSLDRLGQPPDELLAAPAHAGAVAGHHQPEAAPASRGPIRRRESRLAAVACGVGHTPTGDRRSARYQSARVSGTPDTPASPCRTARIWWTAIDPCSKPTRLPLMYSFQTRARGTPTSWTASSHPASSRSTQLRRVSA